MAATTRRTRTATTASRPACTVPGMKPEAAGVNALTNLVLTAKHMHRNAGPQCIAVHTMLDPAGARTDKIAARC